MTGSGEDRVPGSGRALGLAYTMIGAVVFLTLGGAWLDKRRGGGFAFTLTGMGIAVVYMGYEIWKLSREAYRQPDDDNTKEQHSDS